MILFEPEGVPRPYGDELISIAAESMRHHIIDAMGLRRAPDHDVEPNTRLRRKNICTEGSEVRARHDAARRGTLMVLVLATIGLRNARGAEEERAVEV
jgi:hypothetical protein